MNALEYQYVKPEPSTIPVATAAAAGSSGEKLGIDVTGRYVSEIISNSIYVFKGQYKRIEFRMVQTGDKIRVVSTQPDLDIKAQFKDDGIAFTVGKSYPCGCSYVEGTWQLNASATGFSGKWNRSGGVNGSWDLVKVN